ncbi:lysis protein [Lapidilactobacillus wuchangensis]|uniref:lysis protein n=1 Tax=Lapidilactobacillus wuchangensis TaxID=2486001 RepID=UPI000F78AD2F|nr:lysis protein [Lapidilactobacillus wuchangensis]
MIEIIQTANASAIVMIALLVVLITWAIKQTQIDNRWLPLLDMAVGFLIGVVVYFAWRAAFDSMLVAGLDGAIAGLVAAGGYDAVKSLLGGSK